jgi:hypothetical protein
MVPIIIGRSVTNARASDAISRMITNDIIRVLVTNVIFIFIENPESMVMCSIKVMVMIPSIETVQY